MDRSSVVRALFVGGPMYDRLYDRIPAFERATGYRVEVVARLPHPELNARVARDFGRGVPDVDLLSTHTKYAPSQARWLLPLDGLVPAAHLRDLNPRTLELATIGGRLLQVPRNVDLRLLYYRRDLFASARFRRDYRRLFRRAPRVPETWDELVESATLLTGRGHAGFLFPGRDSGLFGTFYEFLVSAGGELFHPDLSPAFDSSAGIWAVDRLVDLHQRRRVTPARLPSWHYDDISAAYRRGRAAMTTDWPGSHYLYRDPRTSSVARQTGVALLPAGFTGRRAAYAGCHSFAVAKRARNRAGAVALLQFLTSPESQRGEAALGAIPARQSAVRAVRRSLRADRYESNRWKLLAETMQSALIIPPRFASYPDCEDAIWRSVQAALVGKLTPAAAVAAAARSVARTVRAERRRSR
ncbi:MAG: extracellular solute-binding protein [Gemmatimonadales bacterium]